MCVQCQVNKGLPDLKPGDGPFQMHLTEKFPMQIFTTVSSPCCLMMPRPTGFTLFNHSCCQNSKLHFVCILKSKWTLLFLHENQNSDLLENQEYCRNKEDNSFTARDCPTLPQSGDQGWLQQQEAISIPVACDKLHKNGTSPLESSPVMGT